MRYALHTIAVLLATAASLIPLSAQTGKDGIGAFHDYSRLLSGEKVYLHTDKDIYGATDTIWISGYVENSSYLCEFEESNYIYIELLCDLPTKELTGWSNSSQLRHEVMVRKKLRRQGNSFQGFIVVPEMKSTGKATLRGYTYWMLNTPVEYMFYKELDIINPMKDKSLAQIQKNKISIRDAYILLGEAPPSQIKKSGNTAHYDYDVQFLPESGNYVAGTDASIYIKGIGPDGLGKPVYGEIISSSGRVLARYSTDEKGFGKVIIKGLPQGKLYASVKDSIRHIKSLELPAAEPKGVVITGILAGGSVDNNMKIRLKINVSEELLGNNLYAIIHNGSEIYYKKGLNRSEEMFSLALGALSPGIHSVSAVDPNGNVYAERPFIVLPVKEETTEIKTDRQQYGKREKVTVTVSVPKGTMDTTANFSIAVTDIGAVDNNEKTDIKSYMLLKSELEGYIEDIDYYFNTAIPYSERMHKADMLMQTHGWRYYNLQEILQRKSTAPMFGREYVQTIAGRIQGVFGLSKKAYVSFMAPSINFATMGQVDSGYFVLKDIDFPEGTRFIAIAAGKNGKSQSHTPIMEGDVFAPVYKYPSKRGKVTYNRHLEELVEKRYYNNENIDQTMVFTLDPVIVTSQYITPRNSPSPFPDRPIKRMSYRDEVAMKPYSNSYDISSYVAASFPGVMRDTRTGMLAGRRTPGSWNTVEVYLNGVYIPTNEVYNTNLLQMPLAEVESIAYVSGLDAKQYQPIHLMFKNYPSPVLMIKTKVGAKTHLMAANVDIASPIGWQKPAKFYSPKYSAGQKKGQEDNRITVYWNPSLEFDKNGEATVTFYTTDSESSYRIEVEGRSSAGEYHCAEKIIERRN